MTIELPDLPYAYDALEPLISSATLRAHYGKHHRGYVAQTKIEGRLNLMVKRFGKSVLPFGLAVLLTACASTPPQESAQPTPTPTSAIAPKSVAVAPETRPAARPAVSVSPLNDPNNLLSKRSIYYDFDKSDLKSEFRPLVEAHAKYLRDHPGANITIQGNCDERGSREYNIALGQRRSQGVLNIMKLLSVPERQMEAVSFGKEKPKALGHDEAAWAEDRRSDIVYQRNE
jgi:peptidoglycan-associated lipoprotein